jgi:phosphatidate phosphatase LPIN
VNVSVNGQPIPFNMKIGEAGEAFFVFETDEDIPEELMTSPILQATAAPDLEAAGTSLESGAEGEKQELGETQEPEFLDLDAHAQDQAGEAPALPVESASRGLDEKTESVNGEDHEPAVVYTHGASHRF